MTIELGGDQLLLLEKPDRVTHRRPVTTDRTGQFRHCQPTRLVYLDGLKDEVRGLPQVLLLTGLHAATAISSMSRSTI